MTLSVAVKSTVTVGHAGEFTVTVMGGDVSVWPRLSVTVRVTVKLPGLEYVFDAVGRALLAPKLHE